MLDGDARSSDGAIVTGSQGVLFLSLPYLPESICIEAALEHLGLRPDLVLSLGGETLVAYCMADGTVRRVTSSTRCAAGSGEFLVQQFARLGMDTASGLAAARQGRRVALASQCSVHCKSDVTHKLNKGECTPADIACSLIASTAAKIVTLIVATGWPHRRTAAHRRPRFGSRRAAPSSALATCGSRPYAGQCRSRSCRPCGGTLSPGTANRHAVPP